MDPIRAIRRLQSRPILNRALTYAIYDRVHGDHFCDFIEIEHAERNREEFIGELIEELQDPSSYSPRTAFAFFPPKNHLCDRRMIYIPLKDLVIRYAIAMIFSEEIEMEVHPECFANRRADGPDVRRRFTEDFASGGWARFCEWQRDESENNVVLLRTDISSFYDSVSHEYLIDAIHRHLDLPPNSEIVTLFRRLIAVPVIHYSPSNGEIGEVHVSRQGLPLGDGVEGYFANIYLKDVDDAMTLAGAHYGRYVDDIRLFGQSRTEVIHHLRILQEALLRKGLNLNSSKTEIAESAGEIAELVSRLNALGLYDDEDADEEIDAPTPLRLDRPFEEFSRRFDQSEVLEDGDDAKDFCRFLSAVGADGQQFVAITARRRWHVDRLRQVVERWRGATKHGVWLLVQTATYRNVPTAARDRARRTILEILRDEGVSSYARYRIVHHLFKWRSGSQPFRLFNSLGEGEQQEIVTTLESWLSAPAFELNLVALYALNASGVDLVRIRRLARRGSRRICLPLRNAISVLLEQNEDLTESTSLLQERDEDEPDARCSPY